MSFKVLLSSALFLSSISAFAFSVPVALVNSSNGMGVPPQYRKVTSCLLRLDGTLVINKTLAGRAQEPTIKKIAFKAPVKNMEALIALRDAAKKGKLKKNRGPRRVGGGLTTYSAITMLPDDRTQTTVIKQAGSIATEIAKPKAAKDAAADLVEFLDYNCNDQ